MATLLCCPTFAAVKHLAKKIYSKACIMSVDVMYDAALLFGKLADKSSQILSQQHLNSKQFRLCTVHRAENTDNRERISEIIDALTEISSPSFPTVLPLHPRTRNCLEKYKMLSPLEKQESIRIIPPVSFLDMVMLEKHADNPDRLRRCTERSLFPSYSLYYFTG